MKLPTSDGPTDALHDSVIAAFKKHGARAANVQGTEVILVANHKRAKMLRSYFAREAITRRIAFYAFGPDLNLFPSQWTATRIWHSGGVVTFSPTFILRSPEKFAQIMDMIRPAPNWAAYIVPSVVEWCDRSWTEPTSATTTNMASATLTTRRCPDSMKAYDALAKAIHLDHPVSRLAGKNLGTSGGLTISCAPPCVHATSACMAWMDWLQKVQAVGNYEALVELCAGVNARHFIDQPKVGDEAKKSDFATSEPTRRPLDLVDIEREQLADMVGMRMRPHLMPYRRYIYIGEVSLDHAARQRFAQEVSSSRTAA
jgi:hypothetical protein